MLPATSASAIVTVRQIYPQLEWRPFAHVPREVWLAAYAMPFEASIQQWSAHAGVDPDAHCRLDSPGIGVRSRSAFRRERDGPDAAAAENGAALARQAKVRYSTPMLFDPDYNIHLGTIYLAGLQNDFGSVESALAAYNAGEDRVAQWNAGPALPRAGGICGFDSVHRDARVRGNRYAQRGHLSQAIRSASARMNPVKAEPPRSLARSFRQRPRSSPNR